MLARGEFGHNAAVFGVKFDLRGNDVGQDFSIAHNGDAGFIAGSFNSKQSHVEVQALKRGEAFNASPLQRSYFAATFAGCDFPVIWL
jgi:hypothetical protein